MDSEEILKNICRVCLCQSIVIDWNNPLPGNSDITYKECFYKYTQLKLPESDPFSSMLCQICSNGLYNVHTFILKALHSEQFFQDSARSFELEETTEFEPHNFESVLIEKLNEEPIVQEDFVAEITDEIIISDDDIPEETEKNRTEIISETEKIETEINNEKCAKKQNRKSRKTFKKSREKSDHKKSDYESTIESTIESVVLGLDIGDNKETAVETENNTKSCVQNKEPKKKKKQVEVPRMCSFCSRILANTNALARHERTHMENRERNQICTICGLKFYCRHSLHCHKRIHKENREKRHKCEFCEKAFYIKSGLNIHRRIHLGQMLPCCLCSKKFYRQIDLDMHMYTHSATKVSLHAKKRPRYYVRCEHCGKDVLSTSYKSHTAHHLNEPLMTCSICNRGYFLRSSCVKHVKKVHQKTNEEYNDFIILRAKDRISHLFLKQTAEVRRSEQ